VTPPPRWPPRPRRDRRAGAQANLGLKRAKQCEDFLGLASWLALKEPEATNNVMRSQLSRLFGQLYALQVGPRLEPHRGRQRWALAPTWAQSKTGLLWQCMRACRFES
jgi:hypothetical protein